MSELSEPFAEQELSSEVDLSVKIPKYNVYDLGTKLEVVVEKIYQSWGYSTIRRQRVKGKSGTQNEIDILSQERNTGSGNRM